MTDNWLIPFAGRNESYVWNLNFLWKKDNIYIMDNHLAALWCWLKEINLSGKYKLLHIDRHYDTANDSRRLPLAKIESLSNNTLDEYLSLSYSFPTGEKYPVFQFDNFIWPLFPGDGSPITEFIFATHNANIPVLGDSEKVIACEFLETKISVDSGDVDKHSTQKKIIDVMEGGKDAFEQRKKVYGLWKMS